MLKHNQAVAAAEDMVSISCLQVIENQCKSLEEKAFDNARNDIFILTF